MPVRSAANFQRLVHSKITQGDFEAALVSIKGVVDQVFREPINIARFFSAKPLDDLCQEIGAINWRKICVDSSSTYEINKQNHSNRTVTIYIVSKLSPTGGHTSALADIVRLGPSTQSVILVTGTTGATDRSAIQDRFESIPDVSFDFAPQGKLVGKMDWLQQKLLILKPRVVWLFNHHQDSAAVAAVQPNAGYNLRYYHHGDHHLCLGVHLIYADHIDPHPMGFHNCRDKLGISGNRYLPLVVKDIGNHQDEYDTRPVETLITCTVARPSKIESPYFIHYSGVIPELLRMTDGKHIHIGRLNPITLFRIKYGIRKLGLPESSFTYIPSVRSVWKSLHEHKVNLYITSFPYGGARTLIEVMGAGIAIALHVHFSSRLVCTFDMVYKGALLWKTPQELYAHIQRLDAEAIRTHGKSARREYEKNYREDLLTEGLTNWEKPLPAPPLHQGYEVDDLQQALDITNQISCTGVLRRTLVRMYLHCKELTLV